MFKKFLISLIFIPYILLAQQNHQLFQMHYLGQSNFLNPAIQPTCSLFIGIPVLSSVHVNYANSGFSYNDLISASARGRTTLNIDDVIDKLGKKTLIAIEAHTSFLALGYRYNEYYFSFSVTEKFNASFILSRDIFNLAWEGNTMYEGTSANTRGTSLNANYYREFALGASKQMSDRTFLGVKAKILNGKLNMSVPNLDLDLYTDPYTFALRFTGNIQANLSGDYEIEQDNGYISDISFASNQKINQRSNPGFVLDAGFIHYIDQKTQLSGSIVDLGFIRWRDDVSNLVAQASVSYEGVLVDSGNIIQSVLDSVYFDIDDDPYSTWLPTKAYLGIERIVTPWLAARMLASAVKYPSKLSPALTVSLDFSPLTDFHLVTSYSAMYRTYNNIGIGLSIGNNPVQFYVLTDNIAGILRFKGTQNFNLRFGLNINLGCTQKVRGTYYYPATKSGTRKNVKINSQNWRLFNKKGVPK